MPELVTWRQPDDGTEGQPDGYRVWVRPPGSPEWEEVTDIAYVDPCLTCYQLEVAPEWEGGELSLQPVWDNGRTLPREPGIPIPLPEVGGGAVMMTTTLLLLAAMVRRRRR